ncbi:class I SAM-dependent methyltransferase [Streptomyces sp. BI20]|uniref:class I SAM-dependent methyltransferase n=1 Tax=Streptomyces sp. BI20 TaxID=3403460 RepID=UPI003C73A8CC
MTDAATRLASLAETLLGAPLPVRIRAWDGSVAGPPEAPALIVHHRRALRRILFKPSELGLARAWVAGEITVEGDLYEALDRLSAVLWERDPEAAHAPVAASRPARAVSSRLARLRALTDRSAALKDPAVRRAVRELLTLARPWSPPPPPPEEARAAGGSAHTRGRDKKAISHHYDVGNEFYELVLGPSMVYSCAYWDGTDSATLEQAQWDKLDLVARKLDLGPGDRLLDVGCGWGSMAIHAAREYGAKVTGVTISREQAAYARKRVAEEGLGDLVEIRVQDYRDVDDGPYDAISSIGMAEHVGAEKYREYAANLYGLLRPGGRLLNHQIARRPLADENAYEIDEFIGAYVFPDGELSPIGTTVGQLERAGFEVRDVEALREHYALTLRAWVDRLEKHWTRAVELTSPGRARVWQLYMAASALAFEHNAIGVNQVLAVKPTATGGSPLPLRTRRWPAA